MFIELEHGLYKCFQVMKNKEQIYLNLKTFEHNKMEQMKAYYECFMKLANNL